MPSWHRVSIFLIKIFGVHCSGLSMFHPYPGLSARKTENMVQINCDRYTLSAIYFWLVKPYYTFFLYKHTLWNVWKSKWVNGDQPSIRQNTFDNYAGYFSYFSFDNISSQYHSRYITDNGFLVNCVTGLRKEFILWGDAGFANVLGFFRKTMH